MFKDQFGKEHIPDAAIVPIFTVNLETKVPEILGTGFFIHGDGYVVTAKHVVEDNKGILHQTLYAVQSISEDSRHVRVGETVFTHDFADIAIIKFGKCKNLLNGDYYEPFIAPSFYFNINPIKLELGVKTYAFPGGKHTPFGDQFKLSFGGKWHKGEIFQKHTEGTAKVKNICFAAHMDISGGTSGGPVLYDGKVIAINSASYPAFEDEPAVAILTPVEYALSIKIPQDIKEMLFNYLYGH